MELNGNLGMTGNDIGTTFTPRLDLNNFEDSLFEGSKYVLTSPRSLEACSRFSIKPVDLLYKPLAEFQEELLPQDIPLRTIYNIYDEHEQDRTRKLGICREERYRIIATEPQIPVTDRNKKTTVRSNTGGECDKGTLQRRRTAWTTSIGHTRLSTKDIDDRANELHHESLKLKHELLSRKETRVPKPKSIKVSNTNTSTNNTRNISTVRASYCCHSKRPSTTRSIRSKIRTTKSAIIIPEEDRKIVELMKTKREAEKTFYSQRQKARLAWSDSVREEERIREKSESRRRALLAEENRIRIMKKREKDRRLKKRSEAVQQNKSLSMLNSSNAWDKSFRRQAIMKEQQLADKREKEILMKRMQELNLKAGERNREAMEKQVEKNLEEEISQVEKRKEMRSQADKLKMLIDHQQERELFEKRQELVDSQNRNEKSIVCTSLELKHLAAKSNLEKILDQKYQEVMMNQSKRVEKLKHARRSQEKMDGEMETWRNELTHRRKQLERKASESVERKLNQTVHRVQEDRKAREKEHKLNIKKVQKELVEWEKSVRTDIQLKDLKSQILHEEKEASILQTRAVAEATQRLRDEVRCKYDNESFQDKARQAEMYNRMGSGVLSYVKNASSLQFG